jgi:hypothetical protein
MSTGNGWSGFYQIEKLNKQLKVGLFFRNRRGWSGTVRRLPLPTARHALLHYLSYANSQPGVISWSRDVG